jgi:hypothetical protein
MSTRNLLGGKERPVRRADNLTAERPVRMADNLTVICEPIV